MLSKKSRMPVPGIAVLLLFELLQANAQNPPPEPPVLPPLFQYNPRAVSAAPLHLEHRLEVTMTTDRTVYFTGEQLELTVTIRNPAREPLTVKQPFLYGTGGIVTLRRPLGSSNENDWQFENPHPILYKMPDPPQIVVSPGEQIRKTLRIPEDCASAGYFSSPCGVRIREGEYRYDFYYGLGASVRFRVARPNLELAAEPKLNKKLEYVYWERRQGKNVPSGKVTLHDGFAGVYVAEYGGSRHLLARRHPGGRLDRKVLEANPSSIVLCPCVRLPYSGKRATRLDASVNPADHLLVEVTDETGTTSRIRLNEKREVIPE